MVATFSSLGRLDLAIFADAVISAGIEMLVDYTHEVPRYAMPLADA